MPSSRRTLLASAAGALSFASAGCLGDLSSTTAAPPDPPDVDCDRAFKPTWTPPEDADEDVESPPPYPAGPPPVDDEDAAVDYAIEFERAYRHHNAGDDDLVSFHSGNFRTETPAAPPDAVACRLAYDTSYRERGAENDLVGEGTGTASYYLDATTVVRGLESWQDGRPVACFEDAG